MKVAGSHDETAKAENQSRRSAEDDPTASNGPVSPLDRQESKTSRTSGKKLDAKLSGSTIFIA